MSMVIGILPVVGLPFPMVSYGGSSMISYFLGFGIILSIHRNSLYGGQNDNLGFTSFRDK